MASLISFGPEVGRRYQCLAQYTDVFFYSIKAGRGAMLLQLNLLAP